VTGCEIPVIFRIYAPLSMRTTAISVCTTLHAWCGAVRPPIVSLHRCLPPLSMRARSQCEPLQMLSVGLCFASIILCINVCPCLLRLRRSQCDHAHCENSHMPSVRLYSHDCLLRRYLLPCLQRAMAVSVIATCKALWCQHYSLHPYLLTDMRAMAVSV
jgi:hypothetical protein